MNTQLLKKLLLIALAGFVQMVVFSSHSQAQDWNEVMKVAASDWGAGDEFGRAVAISGDYAIIASFEEDEDASGGNTLADAGSAYILKRDVSGNWTQLILIADEYGNLGCRSSELKETSTRPDTERYFGRRIELPL